MHCDGTVYRLAETLKIPERKILDFSVPVNPLGVSAKVKAEIRRHLKHLHRYPDPDALRTRKNIGRFLGIDPRMVVCGNGIAELLGVIVAALAPRNVYIPVPTSNVYERAVRGLSCTGIPTEIECLPMREADGFRLDGEVLIDAVRTGARSYVAPVETCGSPSRSDMVIIGNPNIPTGKLIPKETIVRMTEALGACDCFLVVDESCIDFAKGESVVQEVPVHSRLIVLRSLSLSHALAGLRFGYGVVPESCMEHVKRLRIPCTVNSLAQRAAVVALKDAAYLRETHAVIQREKAFIEKNLLKLGITYIASDANFYLVKMERAAEVSHFLRSKGILVGDCSETKGLDSSYIMLAVKSHRENAILMKELARVITRKG